MLHLLDDKNQQEAIRVFKVLEPLLVGSVLKILDPESNDHDFRDNIVAGLEEKNPRLTQYTVKICEMADQYLEAHGRAGIPFLLEQFGQEKIHFYPIVSVEGGMHKMFKYGTQDRPSKDQAMRDLAANFKREYFVAYYEQNGVLPATFEEVNVDPRIKEMIKEGKPGSIRDCQKIPNEAWYKLEFKQNHIFNYFPQVSDLLDDKAITPHDMYIYELFAADALDLIGIPPQHRTQHTKLILELLDRDIIDIRVFYAKCEELGHIPKNWAVIRLMDKEKELKIEARLFSILTFECRLMASTCEKNLADHILPLFKQQSMTLSGSQLRQKMDILTTLIFGS